MSPGRYAAPRAGSESQIASTSVSHVLNSRIRHANDVALAPATTSATHVELYRSPTASELEPLDLPEPAIALEALIRLLVHKKVFSLADLIEELERLKAAHT